jgi:hypothetical protein
MTFRTRRKGGPFMGWRHYPCLKERRRDEPVLGDLEQHDEAKRFLQSLSKDTEYTVSLVREEGKIIAMRLFIIDTKNNRAGVSSWSRDEGFSFKRVPIENPSSIN